MKKISIFIITFLFSTMTFAQEVGLPRNQLFVGPELYKVKREKEFGSKQEGDLIGCRLGYQRLKRYNIYVGIDFLYASGRLEGRAGPNRLHSVLKDINLEERIGYTLESRCWWHASLTPFVGAGNFWEKNHYQHPSPLKVHFDNSFSYATAGFLASIRPWEQLLVGVNFKVRYLWRGFIKVSHDPDMDDHTIFYEERIQYRVEIPLTYYFVYQWHLVGIDLTPFYELRPYGHRANYPFDFLKTTYKLYGATLKFIYLF